MAKPLEEITREALELPSQQRLALAGFLLEVDGVGGDVEAQAIWEEEIRERIRAIDQGAARGISHEEVMREAQKRLAP